MACGGVLLTSSAIAHLVYGGRVSPPTLWADSTIPRPKALCSSISPFRYSGRAAEGWDTAGWKEGRGLSRWGRPGV